MTRAKFEEWARSKGYDLDKWEEEFESLLTFAAYEGWLAGRESMRDEAAAVCDEVELNADAAWKLNYDPDDQGRSNGACDCAFQIRKIEP